MLGQTELQTLANNLENVRARITRAAAVSGRAPDKVRVVAVTKKRSLAECEGMLKLGQLELGENYPQELWRKASAVEGSARWHLIGHLQTNKAQRTMAQVRMIHAVDSLKLLSTLDRIAAEMLNPPSVCLQVNCSGEASKHGWSANGVLDDADRIADFKNVPIVGLMTMAALGTDAEDARPAFALLRGTRDLLATRTGLPLLDLSMGMSHDYESAVEEGATWVRIGTALFEGVNP